jgi:sugar/nucleoside kinase (ribokinase family)
MHSVFCIENPLVDYVMSGSYESLSSFNAKPGTMQLVPYDTFTALTRDNPRYNVMPGGSGPNVIRVLAFLQGSESGGLGRPAFSGAVGRDEAAASFASALRSKGIDVALAEKEKPTGVCAIVVTPDHERTMFTHLGACQDYSPLDVEWGFLRDARYFYSTGYMWDTPPQKEALHAVVDKAAAWSIPCCFDLADPFVVDRYYRELYDWVSGRFSILFGNREELSRMTDCVGSDEEIINKAADLAPLVVMKLGKRGCLIRSGDFCYPVPGESVQARDTTGAGDSFAAGFLYGLLLGKDFETCGALANRIASRIVQVEGCQVDFLDREEVLFGLV